jgi:hypothetical protein
MELTKVKITSNVEKQTVLHNSGQSSKPIALMAKMGGIGLLSCW